jgi:elongation factor P
MISVTDLRNGTKVDLDGGLWECLDYQHQKIGRGGAKVVAKFRSLETGSIVERTFNSGEKLQDVFIDYRTMQFLYADGDTFTFMDTETFEQPTLDRGQIGPPRASSRRTPRSRSTTTRGGRSR